MSNVTQLKVWEYLLETGPKEMDEVRDEFGEDGIVALRRLKKSGHVSFRLDFKVEANELDELSPLPGPFGAGVGQTVEGEKPPNRL